MADNKQWDALCDAVEHVRTALAYVWHDMDMSSGMDELVEGEVYDAKTCIETARGHGGKNQGVGGQDNVSATEPPRPTYWNPYQYIPTVKWPPHLHIGMRVRVIDTSNMPTARYSDMVGTIRGITTGVHSASPYLVHLDGLWSCYFAGWELEPIAEPDLSSATFLQSDDPRCSRPMGQSDAQKLCAGGKDSEYQDSTCGRDRGGVMKVCKWCGSDRKRGKSRDPIGGAMKLFCMVCGKPWNPVEKIETLTEARIKSLETSAVALNGKMTEISALTSRVEAVEMQIVDRKLFLENSRIMRAVELVESQWGVVSNAFQDAIFRREDDDLDEKTIEWMNAPGGPPDTPAPMPFEIGEIGETEDGWKRVEVTFTKPNGERGVVGILAGETNMHDFLALLRAQWPGDETTERTTDKEVE